MFALKGQKYCLLFIMSKRLTWSFVARGMHLGACGLAWRPGLGLPLLDCGTLAHRACSTDDSPWEAPALPCSQGPKTVSLLTQGHQLQWPCYETFSDFLILLYFHCLDPPPLVFIYLFIGIFFFCSISSLMHDCHNNLLKIL